MNQIVSRNSSSGARHRFKPLRASDLSLRRRVIFSSRRCWSPPEQLVLALLDASIHPLEGQSEDIVTLADLFLPWPLVKDLAVHVQQTFGYGSPPSRLILEEIIKGVIAKRVLRCGHTSSGAMSLRFMHVCPISDLANIASILNTHGILALQGTLPVRLGYLLGTYGVHRSFSEDTEQLYTDILLETALLLTPQALTSRLGYCISIYSMLAAGKIPESLTFLTHPAIFSQLPDPGTFNLTISNLSNSDFLKLHAPLVCYIYRVLCRQRAPIKRVPMEPQDLAVLHVLKRAFPDVNTISQTPLTNMSLVGVAAELF